MGHCGETSTQGQEGAKPARAISGIRVRDDIESALAKSLDLRTGETPGMGQTGPRTANNRKEQRRGPLEARPEFCIVSPASQPAARSL